MSYRADNEKYFAPTHAIEQDLKRARELFAACGALRDLERAEAMLQ
jgi:hypothetical protein